MQSNYGNINLIVRKRNIRFVWDSDRLEIKQRSLGGGGVWGIDGVLTCRDFDGKRVKEVLVV